MGKPFRGWRVEDQRSLDGPSTARAHDFAGTGLSPSRHCCDYPAIGASLRQRRELDCSTASKCERAGFQWQGPIIQDTQPWTDEVRFGLGLGWPCSYRRCCHQAVVLVASTMGGKRISANVENVWQQIDRHRRGIDRSVEFSVLPSLKVSDRPLHPQDAHALAPLATHRVELSQLTRRDRLI